MASIYTYRLRAAKGLEDTLVKELKYRIGLSQSQINMMPSRKIIEVQGDQKMLYRLLSQSRILEDVQLKVGPTFIARGEKELETAFQKLPLHCYLPTKEHKQFEMPQCSAKSWKSKLYHTHLIRNMLFGHLRDLPIQRAFKSQPQHL